MSTSLYVQMRKHAGHDGRIKIGIMGALDGTIVFACAVCKESYQIASKEPGDELPTRAEAMNNDARIMLYALAEIGGALDVLVHNSWASPSRRNRDPRDTKAAILNLVGSAP